METPVGRILGGEPAPAPVDPESLDATRPVDLTDCDACHGVGLVVTYVEGDQADVRCGMCGGTGERSPW